MNIEQGQGGQAVSDTPIMDAVDAKCDELGVMDAICYAVCVGQKLELALNEANDHIKRLEEAGDKLSDCADQIGWTSCESPQWIKKAENAVKEWHKAKEAKP